MHRPIDLAGGCLECGGAINPDALRREQLGESERRAQDYIGAQRMQDDAMVDPSVITLNSASVAMAMLDFQFAATAAYPPRSRLHQRIYHAPERELRERENHSREGCRWCDRHAENGSFGRGNDHPLPFRHGTAPAIRPHGVAERVRRLVRQT